MTYQVLARKWRPRSFDTLIGQDHVVRALTHALDTQRLHHAWLFTGTRGVGKTTLSRILAKALNCEQGVSATPCGVCRSCTEIDQGRFVDYVELDAASNRGVDEMTQLLEQAVYAPSAARYKVYMIDEVHMLTGHAFNAMLKTLEEPPAHVKFILATTDPQKIPVTVLSRCLQFNLKQMTVPAIETHLHDILQQEQIAAETPALRLLAQAASGSMRDALSLTDQAIAYSAGSVSTEAVQGMLGTIDQTHLVKLLHALIDGKGAELVAIADDLSLRGLSFSGALSDLAILLSRIAIQQRVPGAMPPDEPNIDAIAELAQLLSPDHVQLFYSVVVHSRDELALAPDEYAGFIMACLRLYALTPAGSLPAAQPTITEASPTTKIAPVANQETPEAPPVQAPVVLNTQPSNPVASSASEVEAPVPASVVPAATAQAVSTPPWENPVPSQPASISTSETRPGIQAPMIERGGQAVSSAAVDTPPWEAPPNSSGDVVKPIDTAPVIELTEPDSTAVADTSNAPPSYDEPPIDDADYEHLSQAEYDTDFSEGEIENGDNTPPLDDAVQQAVAALDFVDKTKLTPETLTPTQWAELSPTLALSGWAAELAQQAEWVSCDGRDVVLKVAIRSADDSQAKSRINTVLNEYFGQVLRLHIEYGSTGDDTAFAIAQAERAQRQAQAESDAQQNPFILMLIQQFDAQIVPDSIRAK